MLENLLLPAANGGVFFGDLASINIQRARDHGIPGYIQISTVCGGPSASGANFAGLTDIPPSSRTLLEACYRTVEDIDPFVGMLLERPIDGSELGRVATCLLLEQFSDSRHGDRFWYERDDNITGFTIEQLTEIRKASLARVICDNSDGVFTIQPKALLRRINNGPNDDVSCDDLPRVDINVFKASKYFLLFAICILDILLNGKEFFFFLQYFENILTHCLNVNVETFAPSYET